MTDQTSTATDNANTSPAKPKKKKRRLLKIVGFLFILLLAFVAFLPTIVSTGFGTGIVLSFVNKSMPGTVEIDDLNVGWFSSTSVNGLRLKDPDGNVIIAASADVPDVTLLSLIKGNKALGNVTLTANEVNIEQYEDGTLNLQRALGPSEKKDDDKPTTYPKGLAVKLIVKAPKATFKPYKQEAAVLTEGEFQFDVASGQMIGYSLSAQTQQGEVKGRINMAGEVKDLFDADGKLQFAKLKIEAPKNSAELPTKLIDSLANAQGKLAAIAGPTVTLTYSASGSLADLKANVNVKGERLTLNADAAISFNDDLQFIGGSFKDGKLLHVKLEEETFIQLAKGPDGKSVTDVKIVPANDLVITNSRVDFKSGEAGIDLFKSTATFTVSPLKFTITDPKLGKRTLTLDAITLNYDGPNGLTNGNLVAQTGQGTETGTLALGFTGKNLFKSDGSIDYDKLTLALDAEVKEFALSLIDELLMTDGMLAKAIGGKLNATAKANLKPVEGGNEGTWSLIAKSDQLDANLGGPVTATRKQTKDGVAFGNVVMALGQPGRVSTRFSQPVLDLIKQKAPGLADTLKKATLLDRGVTLTINQFKAPIDGTLLAKANADVAVKIDPFSYDLSKGEKADPNMLVELQNLTLTAAFAGQGQPVKVGVGTLAKHGNQTADLNVAATVTDLFNAEGKLDTDTLAAKVTAELKNIPTALAGAFINQQDLLKKGLGDSINVTLNADTKLKKVKDAYNYDGNGIVTVKSTNTDVKLTGKLVGDRLQLDTAADASYAKVTITPAFAEAFQKTGDATGNASNSGNSGNSGNAAKWNIAKPTPITLTFTKADLPINGDMASAVLALTASMPELALTGDPRFDGASIRDFKITMNGDTVGKQLNLTANSKLIHLGEEGSLTVTAAITQPLEETRGINANVQVKNAPTALADAFANQDGLIGKLEGKTIGNVALSFKRTGNVPDTFGVDIQSKTLKGGIAGTYEPGKRVTLLPDQRIAASLSDSAMAVIKKQFGDQLPGPLRNMKSINANLDIPMLSLALAQVKAPAKQANKQTPTATQSTTVTAADNADNAANNPATADEMVTKIVAADSRMVINLTATNLLVQRDAASQAVRFDDVAVKLNAAQSLNEANVLVTANPVAIPLSNGNPVAAPSPEVEQGNRGALKVDAVVKGLADKNGYFAPTFSTVKGAVSATNVSASALDDALDQKGLLVGLFADKVNLTSNVDMAPGKPGTFTLNLTSGNAVASTRGIIENDVLKLTEDLKAKVMLTKDMPDVVKNFLVIIKVVSDEKPVELTIPANDFSVPLNFGDGPMVDISKVNATIAFDLGTMRADGDGIAPQLVDAIIVATGGQKQARRVTTTSFSTGNILLKNGVVSYKEPMRMDYAGMSFVYNGEINLNTRSIDKLNILIPFSSIKASKEVQKLSGGIPVPLGGNFDSPKLDGGKLAKEVAGMAFKIGASKLIPGGNNGGLPGLDNLFPPKNKPKDDNKEGNNTDSDKKPTIEEAAGDLLRGVLGGNKPKPKDEPKKEDEKKDEQKSKSGDDGKGLLEGLIGGGKKDDKKDQKKE